MTRALSRIFGEVYAVDVSGKMLECARRLLADRPNIRFYKDNGIDLGVLGDTQFDLAFSIIVFQHIARREVIERYVREVWCLLRPGALFKFQVQGDMRVHAPADDTWLGVPFTDEQVVEMGLRCGFEPRHRSGAGDQYFWAWFFKKPDPS